MRIILTTVLCALSLIAADAPRRAPGFSLPDVKGEQHDLADYRGKVVILEFMQTTCPHCAAFADVLERVRQKYGDKVAILSVSNPPDDQKAVAAYIAGHKIAYPVLFDCGQAAYSYVRNVRFDLPAVYLIDGNGMISRSYEYNPITKEIFEGNGLFPELDRMLGAAPRKK
jgi:peroxiredoxin